MLQDFRLHYPLIAVKKASNWLVMDSNPNGKLQSFVCDCGSSFIAEEMAIRIANVLNAGIRLDD